MNSTYRKSEMGMGKGLLFVLLVLIGSLGVLGWKVVSHEAPEIRIQGQVRGIGKSTAVQFTVRDPEHQLASVRVRLRQGEKVFTVPVSSEIHNVSAAAWWKFWRKRPASRGEFKARIGRDAVPDLKEGRASLDILARNDSWGNFFRGGMREVSVNLPVRFHPPQVNVVTTQSYVNQGGCDLVIFTVSPGTAESGIQVGSTFFPSFPVKASLPNTRLCLYAYPYNVDPKTPAHIVARDMVGNQTTASFNYQVFPKRFRKGTINLQDSFMQRVVPAILSQTPEIQDQGDLLKNYLMLNRHLRLIDAQLLMAYAQKTAPHMLWKQAFLRFPHSQAEAHFADARTYYYHGKVVDRETHLGDDLASTEHAPVPAANSGVVVFAHYFGIYGNAVLIDHGCGLQTLYGHLSSFAVKAGDSVRRGETIGHSGETGLAGGDHLHFSVLLDGVFVDPGEWWDPHWIQDRITAKLAPYEAAAGDSQGKQ